jgi:hypothetical protein
MRLKRGEMGLFKNETVFAGATKPSAMLGRERTEHEKIIVLTTNSTILCFTRPENKI